MSESEHKHSAPKTTDDMQSHSMDHSMRDDPMEYDMPQHSMHNTEIDHASHAAQSTHAEHDEYASHTDHTGHEQMFRNRFWGSLLLRIPVFGVQLHDWLGLSVPSFTGSEWIPFIFSLVIFAYGGIPFIKMAVPEVRTREPGM